MSEKTMTPETELCIMSIRKTPAASIQAPVPFARKAAGSAFIQQFHHM